MSRECSICGRKTASGFTIKRRGMAKKKGGVGKRVTGKTRRKFAAPVRYLRAFFNRPLSPS